jgi:hypothetical protein
MRRVQPRPQKKSQPVKQRRLCPADWEDNQVEIENPDWLVGAY